MLLHGRSHDQRAQAGLQGHDRCGAGGAIERHLAEVVARLDHAERDLAAVLVGRVHLHLPLQQDEQGIAWLAFVQDDGVLAVAAHDPARGEAPETGLQLRDQLLVLHGGPGHVHGALPVVRKL
jgi:hypothetical protein